jgi:hypothetical protein
MRISRKVVALAVVGVLACTGVAFALNSYQFKDGNGNAVTSGTFGENFAVKDDGSGITLNIGGATTNTCHMVIAGNILSNDPATGVKATLPGHVFYGCDHAVVTAQGTWTMAIDENVTRKIGRLSAADVMLRLGANSTCEFKQVANGTTRPKIVFTNGGDVSTGGAATTGVLSGSFTVVSSAFTVNCPFLAGTPATASGNVVISAASNATDNLTVQ